MLVIEADIHEYVRMSYVDKNILGPLVHKYIICVCLYDKLVSSLLQTNVNYPTMLDVIPQDYVKIDEIHFLVIAVWMDFMKQV